LERLEPLDLSARAPRPPRDTIAGVMFLPRTIDKLRGELPGGNLNKYLTDYDRGFTSYVLYKLGIDLGELRAVVARAQTEDEVVAWLTERVDQSKGPSLNAKLEAMRVDAMQPEDRALLYERHPNVAPGAHDLVLDVIDAEDAALTAG
jgi:Domain of unknown function (DUF5069)